MPWSYVSLRTQSNKVEVSNAVAANTTKEHGPVTETPIIREKRDVFEEDLTDLAGDNDGISVDIEDSDDDNTDENLAIVGPSSVPTEAPTNDQSSTTQASIVDQTPELAEDDENEEEEVMKSEDAVVSNSTESVVIADCTEDEGETKTGDCKQTIEEDEAASEDEMSGADAGHPLLIHKTDGSIEFALQLLDELVDELVEGSIEEESEEELHPHHYHHHHHHHHHNHRESRKKNRSRHEIKTSKWARKKQKYVRQYPRRTNALLSGLDTIQRSDDVLIGDKRNSVTIIDVPLKFGPVQLAMKRSAIPNLRKSLVTVSALTARMRLTVRSITPGTVNMDE